MKYPALKNQQQLKVVGSSPEINTKLGSPSAFFSTRHMGRRSSLSYIRTTRARKRVGVGIGTLPFHCGHICLFHASPQLSVFCWAARNLQSVWRKSDGQGVRPLLGVLAPLTSRNSSVQTNPYLPLHGGPEQEDPASPGSPFKEVSSASPTLGLPLLLLESRRDLREGVEGI